MTQANKGEQSVLAVLQATAPPLEDDHPNLLPSVLPSDLSMVPPSPMKRSKSVKKGDMPVRQAAPVWERNRCTIVLEHGDMQVTPSPRSNRFADDLCSDEAAAKSKRIRSYLVASDLSQESGYAVEWGQYQFTSIRFTLTSII